MNRQLREEADLPPSLQSRPERLMSEDDLVKHMATRVSEKLEEGNFKGEVRLASLDDSIAPVTESIYQALFGASPPAPSGNCHPLS